MAIKHQTIVADLETTTIREDLRVWAVCAADVDTLETVHLSNSLDTFMEWLRDKNTVAYFHNLKFDGRWIIGWLLRNGFKYSVKQLDNTFNTLITRNGVFYSITVVFKKLNKQYQKVTFYDSFKKLPFKASVVAKAFELSYRKLSIDYTAPRPIGHQLTQEEEDYIKADCRIIAEALKIQRGQGLTKMTNASDAMTWFKKMIGKDEFDRLFPVFPVEMDSDIRKAYKGGFVWVNPRFKNKRGLQGIRLDVNSLYPWAMYNCLLPYGYPRFFEGEPPEDPRYPLAILRVKCAFELKPDHVPTIQMKHNLAFVPTEYLSSSADEDGLLQIVEFTVTSVDWQLIKEHYNLYNEEVISGWQFKGKKGIFNGYIDYWMHIKETTEGALRTLAKQMLNSLYGKYATSTDGRKKIPVYVGDNVELMDSDKYYKNVLDQEPPDETRNPVYTAMGCFITAYAREKTIRSAQSVFDRFIYADTDSLHLVGYDLPEHLEVHPTSLGAWKHEAAFIDSKFLRPKTYMETEECAKDDNLKTYAQLITNPLAYDIQRADDKILYKLTTVTCAGMPDNVKDDVTYETFTYGATFFGKLRPVNIHGGVLLEETTFTIAEE